MRYLLSMIMLVALLFPQLSYAFTEAPMGLKWGMSKSAVPGGVEFIKNMSGYELTRVSDLSRIRIPKIRKLKELVLIFANDGLQKILIVFEKTKDDVTGSDNKYYYFKIKEILSHKYGKTTNTFEYIGKQVYENKDEFYQCLRYSGCGAYMSFFTSENVNIRVFIEGFRRGVGYVAIEYENEGFRSFKEKIQNKNLKETETTL